MWTSCRLSPLTTGTGSSQQRRPFASLLLLTSLLCLIDEARAASTRVAGLGVGLFLLIFFGVLALLCCCIGFHSHKPWFVPCCKYVCCMCHICACVTYYCMSYLSHASCIALFAPPCLLCCPQLRFSWYPRTTTSKDIYCTIYVHIHGCNISAASGAPRADRGRGTGNDVKQEARYVPDHLHDGGECRMRFHQHAHQRLDGSTSSSCVHWRRY